jgi:signal transduction histidine kinase
MKKGKKRSSRNLKISTRISITTVFGIIIPVIIVIVLSYALLYSITSYFNVSTVTANSYSMLNQLQWNQTMTSISNELISDESEQVKQEKISDYLTPLEKLGNKIYIEENGAPFYSTSDKDKIVSLVNSILPIDTEKNTNYFAENGMIIVTHAQSEKQRYLVIIVNEKYSVSDVSDRHMPQSFTSLMFGKTGLIILIIVLIFMLSTVALSFITSRTISGPIKQLADGANKIADGNLDFVIDYDSTNEIGQTVSAFNDMTRRLKSSLEKQNEIEKSRKEMIAGVAHDLRTPLTSVKGYVEGLRDGIASTPEMQERYLSTIYSSTLSMEKMLDDLLEISRLELGNIELNREETKLNDFLDDVAEYLAFGFEKRDFDFVYTNTCDEDTVVMLDTERFSRVIRNIADNSVKYAKKGVRGKFELKAQGYDKSVIISLSDNGIGVDAQNLSHIFEVLYRADKARSKVASGSGIGLAVCKQIVELHGGTIWASGKEGDGLCINISLQKKTDSKEG